MKLYQHHDEVQDQGKATPKPKAPNPRTGNRTMVRFIQPHNGPLYHKEPRHRLDGSVVYIRIDCCRLGHVFKIDYPLTTPVNPPPTA